MHSAVTIYALIDPRMDGIRYIGQTAKPLLSRLRGHLNVTLRRPNHSQKTRWITELVSNDLRPRIRPLCVVERCEAARIESALIGLWYERYDLTNNYRRGCGTTQETRAKISATLQGHEVSLETRAKLAVAIKGKRHTPEAIAKITAASSGRTHTREARLKIGASAKTPMA